MPAVSPEIDQNSSSTPPELVNVSVCVEELITGRRLEHPVWDENGVLLLAEGSLLTPDFKRLLRQRTIVEVKMHKTDASHTTLDKSYAEDSGLDFSELTSALDSMVDSGLTTVQNTGSSVRQTVVHHGVSAYDAARRQNLTNSHADASLSLEAMIQEASQGKSLKGSHVTSLAANYLQEMVADTDSSLTVAFEASQRKAISDHSLKMSMLSMAIGIEMDLDAHNIRKLGISGLVQDWGMTRVPEAIRDAPRSLTPTEFLEIKKHPMYSLEILQRVTSLPSLVPLVAYQIHERLDGSGYPRGRQGHCIHQFAKILQVADAYIALTSPRSYRSPLMAYSAMECLLKQAQQKLLDASVVRSLLHVLSLFPIGSFISLSDGSVARVLRRNGTKYATPIVQLVQDDRGNPCDPHDPGYILDLAASELTVDQALATPGRHEIRLTDGILNRSGIAPLAGTTLANT